ncbi:MAG: putative transporter [Planctomycetota bacterium]|nr:putative transporter [Planctomycetota bacterium]
MAILSLAVTLGLLLGGIRWRGIRLGVSGVLFSSLLFGQLGLTVSGEVLDFLRDFALIIFVYAIGLQVGPGFLSSFRADGWKLNLWSLAVIGLGALATGLVVVCFGLRHTTASGIFAGAYTTTAGLAAGQDAIRRLLADEPAKALAAVTGAGLAYTVTYPFGLVGPIFTIVVLRRIFKIDMNAEQRQLAAAEEAIRPRVLTVDVKVTDAPCAGTQLKDLPHLRDAGVFFTRMLRDGVLSVPTAETEILDGDIFRAVGPEQAVNELADKIGERSDIDLSKVGDGVQRAELVVTRTKVLRKPLRELDLTRRLGVTIGRVERSGIQLLPQAGLTLYFGDRVTVVGPESAIKLAEAVMGNSQEILNRPQLIPIFLGIVLGVLAGSVPLVFPGLHSSMRMGLAGGPMIVAIILSQLGNIGSLVWYMPAAANQLFRDFGLAVFLACVGLQSGDHFFQKIFQPQGAALVLWGAAVTMVPVFIIAAVARRFFKMNFITLCGLVSGSMTSLPALMFAHDIVDSDAPTVTYATIAPLAMLAPIICAQLLAVILL